MTDRRDPGGADRARVRREAWRYVIGDVVTMRMPTVLASMPGDVGGRTRREYVRAHRIVLAAARRERRADLLKIESDRRRSLR